MQQHFRGVVWPREPIGKQHRYVIVGMLVTNEPIHELEADQIVLDGHAAGMAEAIAMIMQKPSNFRGDANDVLFALPDRLVEED